MLRRQTDRFRRHQLPSAEHQRQPGETAAEPLAHKKSHTPNAFFRSPTARRWGKLTPHSRWPSRRRRRKVDEQDEAMDFSALEAKVDELIALCDALLRENRALKATHAAALERKDLAATKLDALIGRLRATDQADGGQADGGHAETGVGDGHHTP